MRGIIRRARAKMCVLAMGGVTFAGVPFQGCDTAVRTSLVDGLNNAANTFVTALIDAFFLSINEDDTPGDDPTTV